jgi:hypothetical protein
LLRRIARRLQVHELEGVAAYLNVLREQPDELQALLRDLLITVTNFFRDNEAFEALKREAVPQLFTGKTSNDTIRVWICGCATGEEAYSIAILFDEFSSKLSESPKIQLLPVILMTRQFDMHARAATMRRLLPMFRPSVYSAISLKEATSTLSQRTYARKCSLHRITFFVILLSRGWI